MSYTRRYSLGNNNKVVFSQMKMISVYSCGRHGELLVNALSSKYDVRQLLFLAHIPTLFTTTARALNLNVIPPWG